MVNFTTAGTARTVRRGFVDARALPSVVRSPGRAPYGHMESAGALRDFETMFRPRIYSCICHAVRPWAMVRPLSLSLLLSLSRSHTHTLALSLSVHHYRAPLSLSPCTSLCTSLCTSTLEPDTYFASTLGRVHVGVAHRRSAPLHRDRLVPSAVVLRVPAPHHALAALHIAEL